MNSIFQKCIMFGALFVLSPGNFVIAQPIPTPEWVNFFSTNATLDGSPIPVGAVVNAYDPDGVWCGTFTVHTEGEYGFLLVYRDDTTTPDVDEGAEPGDTLTFCINGNIPVLLGPSDPVWTTNGDVIQLDLEGYSNYPPVISGFPDSVVFRTDSSVVLDLNEYVTDLNDPDSTLHWSVSGNDAVIVAINDTTNAAVLSSPLTWSGYETLIFTVTDDSLASDSDTLIVHVTTYLGIMEDDKQIPGVYSLSQNYPNPFNPITNIRYDLPKKTRVVLTIYDILGREIKTLINQVEEPGYKSVIWDGKDNFGRTVGAGMYLYKISAGDFVQMKKMVFLK